MDEPRTPGPGDFGLLRPGAALVGRSVALNHKPPRHDGAFVLYWMVATRRPFDNFGLQRARDWALELGLPLVVLEALRVDYPHASDRLHRFVLEGMADHARYFAGKCRYYPYVERERGAGRGLFAALAAHAAVVVSDAFPTFFLPRMLAAAAERCPVRFERVDSTGLFPLGAFEREFGRAVSFRRAWQLRMLNEPEPAAEREPLSRARSALDPVPAQLTRRFAPASSAELGDPGRLCATLPIDHDVTASSVHGGFVAAERACLTFTGQLLARYGERGDPLQAPQSGLSPYLHFGQLSPRHVFEQVAEAEDWSPDALSVSRAGDRTGFWGMSAPAEAFLDQLITWRELGYQFAADRADHARYDALPAWARTSLARHQPDRRPALYSLDALREARSDDPVWNAAQRQLVQAGTIHGYLRMLWGKRMLEWTATPEEAHARLVELNDRYALDGRDPNSYSGIGWCFGLFDRPWGPERPIFGTVRYMNSAGALRKLRLERYLARFGDAADQLSFA